MNVNSRHGFSMSSDAALGNVVHLRQVVQVRKCRAWGYAVVDLVTPDGAIKKRDKTVVVKFPEDVRDVAIEGSLWEVSGKEYLYSYMIDGIHLGEYRIEAENVVFLRPSGVILARWISSNVRGIGSVIANRLVRIKNLSSLVESCNEEALLDVAGMTHERAQRLFECWPDPNLYKTIEWLEEQQLPIGLGEKLVAVFGVDAVNKIKSHPFLLLAMGVSFEKVMKVVREQSFSMTDAAVVAGVALHVAIKHSEKTRSTVIDQASLAEGYTQLMKSPIPEGVGEIAVKEGLLVKVRDGYQVYGKALMEAAVAQFLVKASKRLPGEDSVSAEWEKVQSYTSVDKSLADYESSLDIKLTAEQREAVVGSVMVPVSCISGGAGTGKTTILKAILGVYEAIAPGMQCYQVALSGRASQRMAESTGRPSQTIAKFIAEHLGEKKSKFPSHLLMVIDEASMVDLLSMYKLISMLPKATRMLFVGDTSQLPPVGDGLVFHALSNTLLPFFNLSHGMRQSEESELHKFSNSIRASLVRFPNSTRATLSESDECSFESNATIPRLVGLWREAGGAGNIVLSPVRRGVLGVDNINGELQHAVGLNRRSLHYSDPLRGWIPWVTPTGARLLEGDPVLVTANNYDVNADIRNGDLGVVTVAFENHGDESGAVGFIEVNGKKILVMPDLLNKLDLGYAITIHKSQGSEWPTCFVMLPGEAKNMIDQTLVYTAITRSTERLVMMGDEVVLKEAVRRGAAALKRKTYLRERILIADGA